MAHEQICTRVEPLDDSLPSLKKYIRVRKTSQAGYIEFDFAIDDPELFVELILPKVAFDAFCKNNNVIAMNAEQEAIVDQSIEKWRYGNDTIVGQTLNNKSK